jgi:hypothetical protein
MHRPSFAVRRMRLRRSSQSLASFQEISSPAEELLAPFFRQSHAFTEIKPTKVAQQTSAASLVVRSAASNKRQIEIRQATDPSAIKGLIGLHKSEFYEATIVFEAILNLPVLRVWFGEF